MIELKRLTKTYSASGNTVTAVAPVELSVRRGEFVTIVGHSGSGKSTLLSLIGGLARPDGGAVLINGKDLRQYNDEGLSRLRNETLGFVYQFASLIPTLTAAENVLLPAIFGKKRPAADAAKRLLERVGLGDKAGRRPSELSGGEQQRVAIARAFINEPELVLADEPTGELDEETELDIMGFFETANRERGVTVLMVTHSSELAARAPRRLKMKRGVLEEMSESIAASGPQLKIEK